MVPSLIIANIVGIYYDKRHLLSRFSLRNAGYLAESTISVAPHAGAWIDSLLNSQLFLDRWAEPF